MTLCATSLAPFAAWICSSSCVSAGFVGARVAGADTVVVMAEPLPDAVKGAVETNVPAAAAELIGAGAAAK